MLKAGSKTKEWNRIKAELKKEFEEKGITSCEIGLESCTGDNFLGFAHTKKRRNVTDLKRVVLACNNCHSRIEYACVRWTGKSMEEFLEGIIQNR